jgi:hypothetical protein
MAWKKEKNIKNSEGRFWALDSKFDTEAITALSWDANATRKWNKQLIWDKTLTGSLSEVTLWELATTVLWSDDMVWEKSEWTKEN